MTSPSSGFTVDSGVLCVGSLPGTMAAHSLMNAIKAKCTPDEAAQLLRELPNKFPNGEDNGQSSVKCVCSVPWCVCSVPWCVCVCVCVADVSEGMDYVNVFLLGFGKTSKSDGGVFLCREGCRICYLEGVMGSWALGR